MNHGLLNRSACVHLLNAVLTKGILFFLLIANDLLHTFETDTPFPSFALPTDEFVDWPWNFSPTVGTVVIFSAPPNDAPRMKVVSALRKESGVWEETNAALCYLGVKLNLSDRPGARQVVRFSIILSLFFAVAEVNRKDCGYDYKSYEKDWKDYNYSQYGWDTIFLLAEIPPL